MSNFRWAESKCPICEKKFFPAPYHAYHDARNKGRYVCSYKCVCESKRRVKARKAATAKKSTPKPEGYTIKEAAELLQRSYDFAYKRALKGEIRYELEYIGTRRQMILNKADVDEYIRRQHESTN